MTLVGARRRGAGGGGRVGAVPRGHRRPAGGHGRAAQVDPIEPKLGPPVTKRLKVKCDIQVSTSAFKFKLRRYITGGLAEHTSTIVATTYRAATLTVT